MDDIIEIYDNYSSIGLKNRSITKGPEIELVKEYINYRKCEFRPAENKKMAVFLEIKVANAYPDIVFVEYSPANYANWNEVRNELNDRDLKILYHIYATAGIDSSDLVKQLGVSWKDAFLSIEKLIDADLLTRELKEWKVKNPEALTDYKIEAVEAKLSKWDEVLQQSIINKNFASESYILTLNGNFKEETLDRFEKFGVGIYLKTDNGFEKFSKAEKAKLPVSFSSIFFNEWIGRILNKMEEN